MNDKVRHVIKKIEESYTLGAIGHSTYKDLMALVRELQEP